MGSEGRKIRIHGAGLIRDGQGQHKQEHKGGKHEQKNQKYR